MRAVDQIKRVIERWTARAGYPMLPAWRLEKREQSLHLQRLLHALGIDCVVDVGANIGQFEEFLRVHLGYHGRLLSFEPVQELHAHLQSAAARNPGWTVHRLAMGDADGDLAINVMKERTLTSVLPRDEAALRRMGYTKYLTETETDRTEVVPVRRLDGILPSLVTPDERIFLKADTQGYDMHVMRGASGCLSRILAIQIELSVRHVYLGSDDYLPALEELSGMGYELTGIFPVQRDAAMRVVNVDCVMIRRSEAERLMQLRNSSIVPGSGH